MAQCLQPLYVRTSKNTVPCGKCAECRARKANEWIIRLNVEFQHATSAYFVTLTYDDFNLPFSEKGYPTLRKTELQDFVNLLRQYAPFRYFSVGEYGDKGERPHYHMLIFNFSPIVDAKENKIIYYRDWDKVKATNLLNVVDTEGVIYQAWKKGIVQVEPLEGGAIRYMANYLIEVTRHREEDEEMDQEKQFALMSKRPPIGYQYYENPEIRSYHRSTDSGKLVRSKQLQNMFKRAKFRKEDSEYALPRLYKNKLFTQTERKHLSLMYQNEHIKQLGKIKNLKLFSKNQFEAAEMRNDAANIKNEKRKL